MCMMTVHSALIEFRFRPIARHNNFKVKQEEKKGFEIIMTEEDEEEEMIRQYNDNGIIVMRKNETPIKKDKKSKEPLSGRKK